MLFLFLLDSKFFNVDLWVLFFRLLFFLDLLGSIILFFLFILFSFFLNLLYITSSILFSNELYPLIQKIIKTIKKITKININKKNPGLDFKSSVEVNISVHCITSRLVVVLVLFNLFIKSVLFISKILSPGFIIQSHSTFEVF